MLQKGRLRAALLCPPTEGLRANSAASRCRNRECGEAARSSIALRCGGPRRRSGRAFSGEPVRGHDRAFRTTDDSGADAGVGYGRGRRGRDRPEPARRNGGCLERARFPRQARRRLPRGHLLRRVDVRRSGSERRQGRRQPGGRAALRQEPRRFPRSLARRLILPRHDEPAGNPPVGRRADGRSCRVGDHARRPRHSRGGPRHRHPGLAQGAQAQRRR